MNLTGEIAVEYRWRMLGEPACPHSSMQAPEPQPEENFDRYVGDSPPELLPFPR